MTTLPPPPAPSPGPSWTEQPPPRPPRRLVRLTDQSKIAGVAAGLGWYFGIDPVLVRIAFAILTIGTGLGIPAYIIAWVVLPEARSTDTEMPPPPPQRDGRSIGLVALGVGAVVLLLGQIDLFSSQVLVAAVLIGIGILLFSDDDRLRSPSRGADRERTPSGPPTPPPAPSTPPPPPMYQGAPLTPPVTSGRASAYTPYAGAWQPSGPTAEPDPPRPPSILGALGLGTWLTAMGVAALLGRTALVTLTPVAVIGLTLAVIGATLLVGTFFGRARGLIIPGIAATLLLVPLSALSGTGVTLEGGFGDRAYAPTQPGELAEEYQLVAGAQELDLTGLDLEGQTVEVTVGQAFGELSVTVPDDVEVEVVGTLTAGERTIFGQNLDGTDLRLDGRQDGVEGAGRIVLDLSLVFGEVTVQSVPVPDRATGPR